MALVERIMSDATYVPRPSHKKASPSDRAADRAAGDGGDKKPSISSGTLEELEKAQPVYAGRALADFSVDPSQVVLERCVGSGCFGDVYQGTFQGSPVAIKSLKFVDEKTVISFRAEALLHSVLHHPNVIYFVGVCWGRGLTGMLLEWAAKGDLMDVLFEGRDVSSKGRRLQQAVDRKRRKHRKGRKDVPGAAGAAALEWPGGVNGGGGGGGGGAITVQAGGGGGGGQGAIIAAAAATPAKDKGHGDKARSRAASHRHAERVFAREDAMARSKSGSSGEQLEAAVRKRATHACRAREQVDTPIFDYRFRRFIDQILHRFLTCAPTARLSLSLSGTHVLVVLCCDSRGQAKRKAAAERRARRPRMTMDPGPRDWSARDAFAGRSNFRRDSFDSEDDGAMHAAAAAAGSRRWGAGTSPGGGGGGGGAVGEVVAGLGAALRSSLTSAFGGGGGGGNDRLVATSSAETACTTGTEGTDATSGTTGTESTSGTSGTNGTGGSGGSGGGVGGVPGSALSWQDPLLRMATDAARGMVYLHAKRWFDEAAGRFQECVVHRDLKPDNLLVTPTFSLKVTDFGLSRAIDREAVMSAVGTPLYAAPELFRSVHYDELCDV